MSVAKIILSTIIAVMMFAGGIVLLLFSHIPFWSLALGVAATQIGIIFLIFTYEKLSKESTYQELTIDDYKKTAKRTTID